MKYYIAYGSNLNKEQMAYRCPDAKPVGTAILQDYRLTFRGNSHTGVANIEPEHGSSVPVGIWQISAKDEAALDIYEGYPHLYRKERLTVELDGKQITALVYVMTGNRPAALATDLYFYTILQGYKDFGLDKHVLNRADAWAVHQVAG